MDDDDDSCNCCCTAACRHDRRSRTWSGVVYFARWGRVGGKGRVERAAVQVDPFLGAADVQPTCTFLLFCCSMPNSQFCVFCAMLRRACRAVPCRAPQSIWTFLCEAQLVGPDKAREQFLQVGRDPRPVMRAAYECFRTGAAPSKVRSRHGLSRHIVRVWVGGWVFLVAVLPQQLATQRGPNNLKMRRSTEWDAGCGGAAAGGAPVEKAICSVGPHGLLEGSPCTLSFQPGWPGGQTQVVVKTIRTAPRACVRPPRRVPHAAAGAVITQ